MLHTSLLELLDERELQSVIAHELGHLKCDHGVWLTVANVLANSTSRLLPVVTTAVGDALFKWIRAAELTCDRCAHHEHLVPVPSYQLCAQACSEISSCLWSIFGASLEHHCTLSCPQTDTAAMHLYCQPRVSTNWHTLNAQIACVDGQRMSVAVHPVSALRGLCYACGLVSQ